MCLKWISFCCCVAATLTTVAASVNGRPNILLVMCDDLDSMLGSPELALPQTKRLLVQNGAMMQNYMVHFSRMPLLVLFEQYRTIPCYCIATFSKEEAQC